MSLKLTDSGLVAIRGVLEDDGLLRATPSGSPVNPKVKWTWKSWAGQLADIEGPWAAAFDCQYLANPITRNDIKGLSRNLDLHSAHGLAVFLASVLVWGTGRRSRMWPKQFKALATNYRDQKRLLCLFKSARNLPPAEAYTQMMSNSGRVPGLGPSFGTKFLYFAGYESRLMGTRPLILDKRVAKSLHALCSGKTYWFASKFNSRWPAEAYGAYIEMVSDAAKRLAKDTGVTNIEEDCVEYALFQLNGPKPDPAPWRARRDFGYEIHEC